MSQVLEVKSEIATALQPMQTMGDLARVVYEQQNIRQEVQDALTKFNYESITRSEFGQLAEMNQDEMKYLDMFWDPAFNSGWLYLSDDIIKTHLTNDKTRNAVSRFYEKTLLAGSYNEGIDYKLITASDELVRFHQNSDASKNDVSKISSKANNRLYYAVTGETYLDLIAQAKTEGGRLARVIFRKVAIAARLMLDYINALHAIMAQKRITHVIEQMSEVKAELTAAKNGTTTICAHISENCEQFALGTFYIASCDADQKKKAYKPGHVDSIDPKCLKTRLSQYNTRGTGDTIYYYIYSIQVLNAPQFDARVKASLSCFKQNANKEIVVIDIDDLIEIVEHLRISSDSDHAFINTYAQTRFAQGILKPVRIITNILKDPPKKQTVTGLSSEDRLNIAIRAINEVMQIKTGDEKWDYNIQSMSEVRLDWMPLSDIIMRIMEISNADRAKLLGANVWIAIYKSLAVVKNFTFKQR